MTAVEICNLALGRIGVKAFIDDLDNTSSMEAIVCKGAYSPSLNSMLASFPWDFAQKLAPLGASLSSPRNGWAYMYVLPADCLNPIRLQTDGIVFPAATLDRIAFQVGYDTTNGPVLLTNDSASYLIYTMKVTNPDMLPPVFADALSWRIASEIAMSLAVKGDFERVCRERYSQALANAAAVSLRAGQDEGEPPSTLITVRY